MPKININKGNTEQQNVQQQTVEQQQQYVQQPQQQREYTQIDDKALAAQEARMKKMEAEVRAHNKEKERKLINYRRKVRRTKIITYLLIFLFAATIIGFGIYNIFINTGVSEQRAYELAKIAVNSSRTSFPDGGVEGFLRENINAILYDFADVPSNSPTIESMTYDTDSLYVTKVSSKSAKTAYVYFNLDIIIKDKNTSDDEGNLIQGESHRNTYHFMLPMYYDDENSLYQTGGVPELVLRPTISNTNMTEIDRIKFDPDKAITDSSKDKAEQMVLTFLQTLYNANDVSVKSFFTTETNDATISLIQRTAKGKSFDGIRTFAIYSEPNIDGYNSYVDYTLKVDSGFTFVNRTYLKLKQLDSGNWVIDKVL